MSGIPDSAPDPAPAFAGSTATYDGIPLTSDCVTRNLPEVTVAR